MPNDVTAALVTDAATQAGLGTGRFETLREGSNIVLADVTGRVVARVSSRADPFCVSWVLHAAAAAVSVGAPVVPPLDRRMSHLADGRTVTFWPMAEPSGPVTALDLAVLVSRLHMCEPFDGLPRWDPSDRAARKQQQLDGMTDDGTTPQRYVSMLAARWGSCAAALRSLGFDGPLVIVHDDFHPGNVLRWQGELVLCDLDGLCHGPREVDLAKLVFHLGRFLGSASAAEFLEAYPYPFNAETVGGLCWRFRRVFERLFIWVDRPCSGSICKRPGLSLSWLRFRRIPGQSTACSVATRPSCPDAWFRAFEGCCCGVSRVVVDWSSRTVARTSVGRAKLSPQQHRRVAVVQRMSCDMYNALLEAWRNQWLWHQRHHAHDGTKLDDAYDAGRIVGDRGTLYGQFAELRNTETGNAASNGDVLWADLALQIGRGVIDRFDKTRSSFYRRCKARKQGKNIKAGYPRFKPWQRWSTIEIPGPKPGMVKPPAADGTWCKLKVKGLGTIRFRPFNESKLTEELAAGGRIQEMRIVSTPLRTEIHLVVRTVVPDPVPPVAPANPVGVDLGVTKRVTLSNGYAAPGVTEDRTTIKKRQRALSKHDYRHASKKTNQFTPGRRRKVQSLRKAHARLTVKERNSLHRLMRDRCCEAVAMLVARSPHMRVDGIAVEKLNIGSMLKNHCLADRILQQRWGMFLRLLEHKAARAGIKIVWVDSRYTSLDCSACSHRKQRAELPLSVRIYICGVCGLVLDRDVNAASAHMRDVLVRGFGESHRVEGGCFPSVWSDPLLTGVPSRGTAVETNLTGAACSGEALVPVGQTKQCHLVNPET